MILHPFNPVFGGPGLNAFDPLLGLPIMDRFQVTPDGILDVPDDRTDHCGLIAFAQLEKPLCENLPWYHDLIAFRFCNLKTGWVEGNGQPQSDGQPDWDYPSRWYQTELTLLVYVVPPTLGHVVTHRHIYRA
jgi:hypothetical protein